LSEVKSLRERIHEANVKLYQFEAKYYEVLRDEIYGRYEQKRIYSTLKRLNNLIISSRKKALDFGAGAGNITGKLLQMGFRVTAIDISPDMCGILKNKFKNYLEDKKLEVINLPIEDINYNKQEFDLIACYSVLHHLPDYEAVIHKLSTFLKKGGIMYLDHEGINYSDKPSKIERLAENVHFLFNSKLNSLFLKTKGVTSPSVDHIDYSLSDYWTLDEHKIDHNKIKRVFEKENYSSFKRIDYLLNRSWIFSPTFYLYKCFSKPDCALWIARK
jgi:2-polyprenyl-3-methyl-5-hydroxy-6-metoxy-1,4-benzoquinol methylase